MVKSEKNPTELGGGLLGLLDYSGQDGNKLIAF